jgi:Na+/proline symporter
MADTIQWKYWMWLAIFSSPLVPIAIAGRWWLSEDPARRRTGSLIPLLVAIISLFWFIGAIVDWSFLGPLYSDLRYAIAGGNLIAVLLSSFVSFRSKARVQGVATGIACLMISLEWLFIGVANR